MDNAPDTLPHDKPTHDGLPLWLTVPEAATQLRVTPKALYSAIRRGEVPVRRVAKWIRVPREYVLGQDVLAK
jgi:excisionase family DNA binding protein